MPTPKVTDPLSLIDYVAGQTPLGKAVKTGKGLKKASEKLDDIFMRENDLTRINDWVESTKDMGTKEAFADVVKNTPLIKKHSIKYLKDNNLVDKNNNVTLYRYLNLAESNKLKPDVGLTSTTLNPAHAQKQALSRAEINVGKIKPGEKADIFDSMDPISLQSKYETKKLIRQPVVLEYKIPVEKVDAYIPAIYRNLDTATQKDWMFKHAETNWSNLVDDLVDDGYDYYDAEDEVANSYTVTSDFDNFAYTAFDESEIITDLTNIKPTNMFVDKKAIDTIAKLADETTKKLAKGGPTVIDELPVINPVDDVGSITPISPFEMNETFGGPLYQMLNPGAQQLVDKLGLRGKGLAGFAAEAIGPGKFTKITGLKIKPAIANKIESLINKAKKSFANSRRESRNITNDGNIAAKKSEEFAKEGDKYSQDVTDLFAKDPQNIVYVANKYPELVKNNTVLKTIIPKIPKKPFDEATKLNILNQYKPNNFTDVGKIEFLDSIKPKSVFGPTIISVRSKVIPKNSKDYEYFTYNPDTYESYRIGAKFDNVEQAILYNKGQKNVLESGMRLQVRKGNPKNIEKTKLLYEDISGT